MTQLNAALLNRYQVLHPNQALPPAYALSPSATEGDYTRLAAALGEKNAAGTTAQRDLANQQRADAAQQRLASEGIIPVTGVDKSGNTVLTSLSDAKTRGLTQLMKADNDVYNKATAARGWIPLAAAKGNPPDPASMGILQLIDALDAQHQLGPVASRWLSSWQDN